MGSSIHTQGHTRNHRPASAREGFAKLACIAIALRRRIAATYHSNARLLLCQPAIYLTCGIQQHGRVSHIKQRLRIIRIAQNQQPPLNVCSGLLQPLPGSFYQRFCLRAAYLQRCCLPCRNTLLQTGNRLRQNLLRQAKCRKQAACSITAYALSLQQMQPRGNFIALHIQIAEGCLLCGTRFTVSVRIFYLIANFYRTFDFNNQSIRNSIKRTENIK